MPPPRGKKQKAPDELAGLRAAEQVIEDAEQDRDAMRAAARAAIGIVGSVQRLPARRSFRRGPWIVSGVVALSVAEGFPAAVLALIGLPIAAGLGESGDLVLTMAGAYVVFAGIGGLLAPAIARAQGGAAAHARTAVLGTFLIAVGLALVGLVSPVGGMGVAGVGAGLNAVGRAVSLARRRELATRVRGVAAQRGGAYFGVVIAAALIATIAYGTGALVWAILLGLCVPILGSMAAAADLVEQPGVDGDLERLREVVDPDATGDDEPTAEPFRRVWAIATLRALVVGYVAVGFAFVALHVFVVRFLTLETGLGLWGRGLVYAAIALAVTAAIRLSANRDEQRFQDNPARLAGAASSALLAAGVALVAAVVWPWYSQVLLLVAGFCLVGVAHAQMDAVLVAAVRPRLRGHAIAVSVGATLFLGAGLAVPLLRSVAARSGTGAVLVACAVVLVAGGLAIRRVRDLAPLDIDAAVDDEIETAQVAVLAAHGVHLPLLAVRHVDFSYGSVQVLFDVSFSVDDGEMVGLLGTNGAGKSTLLRVISGLGTPTTGTVRMRGEDVTYLDPAARVGRGITQVPGGKAVFGPLSVVDNLRVHGHSLGRDRVRVDRGIELAFETFPRLAERRNLPSRVLSGGERQMLALSKALILEPRLLLIDELSLGLAPTIVGQLLEMVRAINAKGTAVVLVEQSVNVALSLVNHAYYMEKGEIRFDGPARELLERPDLLRSIYLQGAAEGLA